MCVVTSHSIQGISRKFATHRELASAASWNHLCYQKAWDGQRAFGAQAGPSKSEALG